MSTLQSEDCQTNDLNESSNDLFPTCIESLRFPLDNSMRIVFTGYYNGYNVEVRSTEEMDMLYHMGCFGKGSASRSRPTQSHRDDTVTIMRRRQFLKRNYWYQKFYSSKGTTESDLFLKEVDEVSAKIDADCDKRVNKDVIDLVSSDESSDDEGDDNKTIDVHDKDDVIVIVPNSDSEEDNYFAKMKPKCCINKIKVQEKLILTLQEAFFLLYGLGCLQIISMDNNILSIEQCWDLFKYTDKRFVPKYVVYHYFRSKGYIVKPGIKFGGDYCKYKLYYNFEIVFSRH